MDFIRQTQDGVLIRIKLVPRAAANQVDGRHGDAVKIRLNAPPVDGKANAALLRFLADKLDLPVAALAITAGHTGRNKTVRISGLDPETVRTRLAGP